MSVEIYEGYPPKLSAEQEQWLVQAVKDWTIEHGLVVRPSPAVVSDKNNPYHVLATNAPVTLFPSPFPRSVFDQARNLQTTYNDLYAAVASDESWLEDVLKESVCTVEIRQGPY